MTNCIFVSDLHGSENKFRTLFNLLESSRPEAVFIGGDIMPGLSMVRSGGFKGEDFLLGFIVPRLEYLRKKLGEEYPRIFIILGNDDGKRIEPAMVETGEKGLWEYIHGRKVKFGKYSIYGYAYVPPTPFRLKDWERYDVSRYVDPGCVSPEEGTLSVSVSKHELRYSTMERDLAMLAGEDDLSAALFLFHSPPYQTSLDRAALDGKMIDHAPLDVHVGSIAIRRFIEQSQPLLTLHGHIHESTRMTGEWSDRIGNTLMFNAAHSGPELSVISFNLENLNRAGRKLI